MKILNRIYKMSALAVVAYLLMGCGKALELDASQQQAADNYLTLIDRSQYMQVWEQAAEIFKAEVSRDNWLNRMSAVHAPLGKPTGRALRTAVAKSDPANSPAGEYVMVTFDTIFANTEVVETLVLYQEQEQWLLAGYFVK